MFYVISASGKLLAKRKTTFGTDVEEAFGTGSIQVEDSTDYFMPNYLYSDGEFELKDSAQQISASSTKAQAFLDGFKSIKQIPSEE
jgi:hypothetical protein